MMKVRDTLLRTSYQAITDFLDDTQFESSAIMLAHHKVCFLLDQNVLSNWLLAFRLIIAQKTNRF